MGASWYVNWLDQSKLRITGGHSKEVTCVTFSGGDSALLASSSLDGSLAVWKPQTREQLVQFQAPNKSCCSVAFAPPPPLPSHRVTARRAEGEVERKEEGPGGGGTATPTLAAGYGDGTVRVFDVGKGKMVRKMQPHAEAVKALAFFSDGER